MALVVLDPGPLTTVQDGGRLGWERYGVPPSGPMDWYAFRAANLLVGNDPRAAGLEFAYQGPSLLAEVDLLVAATGGDLRIGKMRLPGGMATLVGAGQIFQVERCEGCWAYLAVAGGLDVPTVLGSRATYLKGKFGGLAGRQLMAGDRLGCGTPANNWRERAGSRLREAARPVYTQNILVRVVAGPQLDWFEPNAVADFIGAEYRVLPASDRMGYRLSGPTVHRRPGDLLSEGMAAGSLQVPPDGQPIVMLADRPTTGGYPKIATVIRADIPKLTQLRPGEGRLRFAIASVEEAQAAYREMIRGLTIETEGEERWASG